MTGCVCGGVGGVGVGRGGGSSRRKEEEEGGLSTVSLNTKKKRFFLCECNFYPN